MAKRCQNPLCGNEATKEVPVSANKAPGQVKAVCAACHEAYTWGVQHGRTAPDRKRIWVLAVADRGNVVHGRAFSRKPKAVQGLVQYLRTNENYTGPADMPSVCAWLAEHDERLSADIFAVSLDAD